MWKPGNERVEPAFYNELERSKSIAIEKDEYDVFGDGTVVIKAAPGHTPGHQVLVLRLASTGRVMLGGDLYHYPPERTLRRAPPDNEFNVQQSAASRAVIEEYLTKTKTTIWIEHDFATIANLKKSPVRITTRLRLMTDSWTSRARASARADGSKLVSPSSDDAHRVPPVSEPVNESFECR